METNENEICARVRHQFNFTPAYHGIVKTFKDSKSCIYHWINAVSIYQTKRLDTITIAQEAEQ